MFWSILLAILIQFTWKKGIREYTAAVHLAAAASVKGGIYSAQTRRFKLVWAPRTGLDWGLGGGPGRTRSPEYLFDLQASMKLAASEVPPEKTIEIGSVKLGMFSEFSKRSLMLVRL